MEYPGDAFLDLDSVIYLSVNGTATKPPGSHPKYLKLCSEDKQSFYGFGTTWGQVKNDNIFILGRSIPLNLFFLWNLTVAIYFYPGKHFNSEINKNIPNIAFIVIDNNSNNNA